MLIRSLLILVLSCLAASCVNNDSKGLLLSTTRSAPDIKSFMEWGTCCDGFFASSTDGFLVRWKWNDTTITELPKVPIPASLRLVFFGDDKCLGRFEMEKNHFSLQMRDTRDWSVIKSWPEPARGYCEITGRSLNGKYGVVLMTMNDMLPIKHVRIAIVDVAKAELSYVGEIKGEYRMDIRSVCVTDDAEYVVIAGWEGGIAVVETATGKTLWKKTIKNTIHLGRAVLAPDGVIYAGDTGGGGYYQMELLTGQVLDGLSATEKGIDLYGHRISAIAVSPDGKWLAAGTGPSGEVYLWNRESGQKWLLKHGHSTILIVSFSPDSKYLATMAGGLIKTWKVPDVKELPD